MIRTHYENFLKSLGEHFVAFSHTLDGKITYVSDTSYQLIGQTPDELIGKNIFDSLQWHNKAYEKVNHNLYEFLHGETDHGGTDFEIIHPKTKQILYLRSSIYIQKDDQGVPFAIDGVLQDISESKLEKTDLQNKQKQLEQAFQISKALAWTFDVNTQTFTFTNASEVYGYKIEEINTPQKLFSHLDDEHQAIALQDIESFLKGSQKKYSQEFRLINKNGSLHWLEVSMFKNYYDTMEKEFEVIGMTLDITDRKAKEFELAESIKQIQHQKKQLQLSNELLKEQVEIITQENLKQLQVINEQQNKYAVLGEMMDAIAHQWKQPLTIINNDISNLELNLLLGEPVDHLVAELPKKVTTQVQLLVETLDDFRQFFRSDVPKSKVDIKKQIKLVLDLCKTIITSNKITIEFEKIEEIKYELIPTEFKHVLLNLINNAKDAFNDNKIQTRVIRFSLYQNDTSVIIEVVDNAGGIPPTVLDTLFEVNVTTKQDNGGTGVGLYMSKQIIEKLDGKISVENLNDGAKFTIELPKT